MPKPTKREIQEFLDYANLSYDVLENSQGVLDYDKLGASEGIKQITKANADATVFYNNGQAIVAIRGTDDAYDWLNNINALPVNISDYVTTTIKLKVHQGFLSYTLSLYEEIKEAIGDKPYSLTGHSLGSSSATLFAILYYIDTGKKPLRFINFASPRVIYGDTKDFEDNIELYRVAITDDMVVFFPPKNLGFRHVGTPLLWNAIFLEQPQFYPTGYDEDQLTTYFYNQLFGIGTTWVGTSAVKIFLVKVFDIFSRYKGYHTNTSVDRNTIYNYIFTKSYAETRMTDRSKHLEEVVNSISQIKQYFPSWDEYLKDIDINAVESNKDIYKALIKTYTDSVIAITNQITIGNSFPNLKSEFEIIGGTAEGLEEDLNILIQSIEEASEDFDIGEDELYVGLQTAGNDILSESFKQSYDLSTERINQLQEQTATLLDKTLPITNSIVLLKHIFTLITNAISYGTCKSIQEYLYNFISMVEFHGINKYEELILNMDTDTKQTIEISAGSDVIVPEIIFDDKGNQATDRQVNQTDRPSDSHYYNIGNKPPEETRQIDIVNFNNEFTKVGTIDGNHIYTDGENEYILEGNKETTYLRHKTSRIEPKILGYIVMTDGIKYGDVVVY